MLSSNHSASRRGIAFNLLGIPVRVDVSFFLLSGLLAMQRASQPDLMVEWVAVVFVSILIHELGHALTGRAFRLAPRIELYSMGGLTSFPGRSDVTPPRSIAISVAGPAAGFLAGGIVYLFRANYGPGTTLLSHTLIRDLVWVNLGWGVFNLLPVLPLDGGHISQSIEEWILGRKGAIGSEVLSVAVGTSVAAWAIANRESWIVFLMGYFVYVNGRQLYSRFGRRADAKRSTSLEEAWRLEEGGDAESALKLAEEVLRRAKLNPTKGEATAVMALSHYRNGRRAEAKREIDRLHACYGSEPYNLLLERGQSERAARLLAVAFELTKLPWVGRLLGLALVKVDKLEEAMELCLAPALAGANAVPVLAALESRAFQAGNYQLAAQAGRELYNHSRAPETAYNVACALARASMADEAMEWLREALRAGFANWDLVRTDPDLDSLRARTDFAPLVGESAGA